MCLTVDAINIWQTKWGSKINFKYLYNYYMRSGIPLKCEIVHVYIKIHLNHASLTLINMYIPLGTCSLSR